MKHHSPDSLRRQRVNFRARYLPELGDLLERQVNVAKRLRDEGVFDVEETRAIAAELRRLADRASDLLEVEPEPPRSRAHLRIVR